MRSLLLILLFLSSLLSAQDENKEAYRAAAAAVEIDLRAALDELAALRESIAVEKVALAKETNKTAADFREQKRKSELATTRKDEVESEFEATETNIAKWRDEKLYLDSLLLDFRKNYEVSQSLARIEAEKETLLSRDLEARLDLVEKGLEQLARSGAAGKTTGKAVGPDGVLVPGTFIEAGPVSWFLSENKIISGLVSSTDDLRSTIIPDTASKGDITALIEEQPAAITFDPTLGTAVALAESDSSILSHIEQGGFWIFPILFLGLVALAAALYKWIQLMRIKHVSAPKIQSVIDTVSGGDLDAAQSEAEALQHPAGAVLARGIAERRARPEITRDNLEETLYETYLESEPQLQRGLALIAITSATAPLLGLLGTVTGMIETFRLINIFGTGDAQSLASGISEALVTTEFGLIVAIPALIFHALLSRKIQGIKTTTEMASLAFLNGVETRPEPAGK